MRPICVVFIFFSIFSSAFGQSRISGNQVTDGQLRTGQPLTQGNDLIQGDDYSGNLAESAYNYSKQYFQPGVIITKDGDTLSGLVKYAYPAPSDKVFYKANLLLRDSIFSVLKIKSIITQFVYLANIPFEGKEKMMPWLAVGKINLYVQAKYYDNSFFIFNNNLSFNMEGLSEITYVLEKNNQFNYINNRNFKVMMRHIFFDTPDMLEKIGRKGYRFDDMIRIIRDYNKRFQ